MEILRYASDLLSSNMYVVKEGAAAVVIDPFRSLAAAEGLAVEKILLTHEHYDHISGVNLWKAATGAPVLCSRICGENLQNPRKNLARLFDVFCDLQTWIPITEKPDSDENYTCTADEVFEGETTFDWRGHRFRLFEMPGHSMGSIGIVLDESAFFSGDSLMKGLEIELRFPGGSRRAWKSIGARRLAEVPEGIRVFPGHFDDFILERPEGGE